MGYLFTHLINLVIFFEPHVAAIDLGDKKIEKTFNTSRILEVLDPSAPNEVIQEKLNNHINEYNNRKLESSFTHGGFFSKAKGYIDSDGGLVLKLKGSRQTLEREYLGWSDSVVRQGFNNEQLTRLRQAIAQKEGGADLANALEAYFLTRSHYLGNRFDEQMKLPTDASVAAILDAIKPLLPTPHKITFDWHFAIFTTALLNEALILFFNFCRAFISRLITSFAIDINFFLFINETKYHL